jgi:hypothetical protein
MVAVVVWMRRCWWMVALESPNTLLDHGRYVVVIISIYAARNIYAALCIAAAVYIQLIVTLGGRTVIWMSVFLLCVRAAQRHHKAPCKTQSYARCVVVLMWRGTRCKRGVSADAGCENVLAAGASSGAARCARAYSMIPSSGLGMWAFFNGRTPEHLAYYTSLEFIVVIQRPCGSCSVRNVRTVRT